MSHDDTEAMILSLHANLGEETFRHAKDAMTSTENDISSLREFVDALKSAADKLSPYP